MTKKKIKEIAEQVFEKLQPFCVAIYLGGSYVEKFIINKHDVDFICFAKEPKNMCHIRRLLYFYNKKYGFEEGCDFIQVRTTTREEHAYGSYINKKMEKLIGQDITFDFDVINKDRAEYVNILKLTIDKLNDNKIKNQKRWYQVLRGYYILKNNSYDVSETEAEILNKVHDQVDGWESYKISKEDVEEVK